MIYNKDRLDAAYAKVGLFADTAWQTNVSDGYVRANQELWTRECALKNRSERLGIPRSILDTIPNSRLAEYGTYVYDETRECAYEPVNTYFMKPLPLKTERISAETYLNHEFRNEDLFQSQEVENLFHVLSDTNAKCSELEERCQEYLKDLKLKQINTELFTLFRNESVSKLSESSETTESDSEIAYEMIKIPKERTRYPPPRGNATTFSELILQMQLHSEDVRSLWSTSTNAQHLLNVNVPEFYPKYCHLPKITEDTDIPYDMVASVQPWLNYGYPLRHSDFNELESLSSEMESLRIPDTTSVRQVSQAMPPPPPPPPPSPPVNAREPTRRLYSAVLQSSSNTLPSASAAATSTASAIAATTISTDELDELEREAIEQYRPSVENLAKSSEDSIVAAKFQELERLALEQYNSVSATEISAVGAYVSGNGTSPQHESLCGGKLNQSPYAALLLANSVLVGFYRSVAGTRLLSCLGGNGGAGGGGGGGGNSASGGNGGRFR